ncbi:MAG: hypothetical protein VZR06_10120, partial [Butyrivibrio sp.]|nr:hypothetical protein [Butyrivibrio sp.]
KALSLAEAPREAKDKASWGIRLRAQRHISENACVRLHADFINFKNTGMLPFDVAQRSQHSCVFSIFTAVVFHSLSKYLR